MVMTNFDNATPTQSATAGLTQEEVMELVKRGYVTDPGVASNMFKYAASKDPSNNTQQQEEVMTPMQSEANQADMQSGQAFDVQPQMSQESPPINSVGAPNISPEQFQLERDILDLQQQNNTLDARDEYEKSLQNILATQEQENARLSAAYQQQRGAIGAAQGRMERFQSEQENAYERAFAEHEAAKQEAAEFIKNKKGFWESRTDGQKAMALIAVALGGFVEGYTEGRVKNSGVAALESTIKQYVTEQEIAYNRIKDKQEAAKTLFGMIQQRTGDKFATQKIMMELGLKSVANTIDSLATSSSSKVKAAELKAEIDKKMMESQQERQKALQERELQPSEIKQRGLDVRFIPPKDEKARAGFINGFGTARNNESAEKLIDGYIAPTQDAAEIGKRLITMIESPNSVANIANWTRSGQAEADTLALRGALKPIILSEAGKMSDSDRALLEDAIQNPTTFANTLSKERRMSGLLRQLISSQISTTEKQLKNRSLFDGSLRLSPELEEAKKFFSSKPMETEIPSSPFGTPSLK